MSEKLKPCPFCDGDDIEFIPADIIAGTQYWRIFCYGCGCTQTPISSKNEAIEEWNKRANPWHTGTPTEDGDYLLITKIMNLRYDVAHYKDGKFMSYHDYYFNSEYIIAWQKIEPYEEEK